MNDEHSIRIDLAQREAALARARALLSEENQADDQQCDAELRYLLAGLAIPFEPESSEIVARTVTNLGVALGQGIVPRELHEEVVQTLLEWLEDTTKGIEPMWRSHIALRLGNVVYKGLVDPHHCDEIARRLIAYAAGATIEDELLEHSVEALFMASWEQEALGIEYAQTICSALLDHIVTKQLSITMLGRMLHAGATTLIQKKVPLGLGDELIQQIINALPLLRAAKSRHYGLLAWTLSDAAARDLAQNVPLDIVEGLIMDEDIEESFREQMKHNIAVAQMMQMLKTMSTCDGGTLRETTLSDIEERLIRGLM